MDAIEQVGDQLLRVLLLEAQELLGVLAQRRLELAGPDLEGSDIRQPRASAPPLPFEGNQVPTAQRYERSLLTFPSPHSAAERLHPAPPLLRCPLTLSW